MARLKHRRTIDGSGRKVGNLKIETTSDGRSRVTARRGADEEDPTLWDRFKEVIAYARKSKRLPEYVQAAEILHTTPFKAATADFLHPPEIRAIDLEAYHGRPGDPIRVHAVDDRPVNHVGVLILDRENHLIEMGLAQADPSPDWWSYQATRSAPSQHVRIIVDVTDMPGHADERRIEKDLP